MAVLPLLSSTATRDVHGQPEAPSRQAGGKQFQNNQQDAAFRCSRGE